MSVPQLKRYSILLALVFSTAIVLSLIWKVAYLYTLIGFAVWTFAGHIITIDDDLPNGWSNPERSFPFPWIELAIKAAVLLGLLGSVFLIPSLRTLGT